MYRFHCKPIIGGNDTEGNFKSEWLRICDVKGMRLLILRLADCKKLENSCFKCCFGKAILVLCIRLKDNYARMSSKHLIFIRKVLFSLNCDRISFVFQTLDCRIPLVFKGVG